MRITGALAITTCAALIACASPAQIGDNDPMCAALAAIVATPSTTSWPQLSDRDEHRMSAIPTSRVADNGYVCSDTRFREAGRGNAIFFELGLSAGERYASVAMGSADFGQRCLLRRRGGAWSVVGCSMLWIA